MENIVKSIAYLKAFFVGITFKGQQGKGYPGLCTLLVHQRIDKRIGLSCAAHNKLFPLRKCLGIGWNPLFIWLYNLKALFIAYRNLHLNQGGKLVGIRNLCHHPVTQVLNQSQNLFREYIVGTHQYTKAVAVAEHRLITVFVYPELVAAAIPPFAAVCNLELDKPGAAYCCNNYKNEQDCVSVLYLKFPYPAEQSIYL